MGTHFLSMSVGELITALRDGAFFVGILVVGWKARSFIQPAIDFIGAIKATMLRATSHMETMETGMKILLENHLVHIESDLARMSGRRKAERDHTTLDDLEI